MAPRTLHEKPIEQLIANPQIREHFDEESIAGLAQSIREVGILQPISVRPQGDLFAIIDGERRYRAALMVGLATVPVIIDGNELRTDGILQSQLIANCQREDLAPLEKARAIAQLIKTTGCSQTQAAAKLGIPNATVTRSLAILMLPESLRDQVNQGHIPASAAYDLARIKDPQEQATLATRLQEGSLTRDALAGTLRARKKPSSERRATVTRVTAILSPGRTITVADEQLDLDKLIASLEELLIKARKARTQGIELGTFSRMLKDQTKP
jgi:ParB family transcriptional regulator, chromosome partitioning protein